MGIEQIPWNVRTLINQKTLSDVMRGVLSPIHSCGVCGVGVSKGEEERIVFFFRHK